MNSEESSPSLKEMLSDAIDVLTKFSVPLYVNDDRGRPIQYGTGFFVHARGMHFLASAAHVLDETRSRRVFYFIMPDTERRLTGPVLTTSSPEKRGEDNLDVGVLKLTGEAVPPYRAVGKFAMGLDYLKRGHVPRSNKHYVMIGFPASKSEVDNVRRTTSSMPYAHRSDSIDESQYGRHGCDPATHVVLPLDRRKTFDMNGKRIGEVAHPQGMSGSPITVLYDLEEEGEGSSRVFPVVAVGIEYRKAQKVSLEPTSATCSK